MYVSYSESRQCQYTKKEASANKNKGSLTKFISHHLISKDPERLYDFALKLKMEIIISLLIFRTGKMKMILFVFCFVIYCSQTTPFPFAKEVTGIALPNCNNNITKIKRDKSFIKNLVFNNCDQVIVEAIIKMSGSLGITDSRQKKNTKIFE